MGKRLLSGSHLLALTLIITMLFSILAVSGCGIERRPAPTQPAPGPATPAPAQPNQAAQPAQETQRAQMLAQKISSMEEINAATVVVVQNSAWVGVDMKAGTAANMTDQTKNRITELVKAEDNAIQTVFVTADADTVTRLRNIAQSVAAGQPLSGFITELNEMGRRITPSAR